MPFNWRVPLGYVTAMIIQASFCFTTVLLLSHIMFTNMMFGNFFVVIGGDIIGNYQRWDAQVIACPTDRTVAHQIFVDIVELHAYAKE